MPDRNRNAIICCLVFAKPQAVLKMRNIRLAPCMTLTRPKTSESGPGEMLIRLMYHHMAVVAPTP